MSHPRAAKIILGFAVVYLVWGSTYLAIRIGVQHLPPALFAGVRFLVAGVLMLAYARWTGAGWPAGRQDWRNITVTALLMLVCGNGLVTWSEQWVESNQAALIVATSALWLAWVGTWGRQGEGLGPVTIAGLVFGFAGVAVLVGGGIRMQAAPPMAYGGLMLAPMAWAAGSVWSRRQPTSCPPAMTAALQTLIAGVVLSALGLTLGELPRWNWNREAMLALAYLVVFGSFLAYGAYFWLVHQVSPARLGTYAYVNPAVAVLLGWWILDEHLDRTQVLGTLVILAGVLLVSWPTPKPKTMTAENSDSH